jgi:acetyl-CoA synthetase
MSSSSIESVLNETRSFAPPKEFSAGARVGSMADYEKLYRRADEDPEGFWADIAGELAWSKKWNRVLDWKLPDAAAIGVGTWDGGAAIHRLDVREITGKGERLR